MWAAILAVLQALLPGIFGQAISAVVDVKKAQIDRAGDQAHIDAGTEAKQIDANTAAAADNARLVSQEIASPVGRWIRPAFLFPLWVWWATCIADKTVLPWFGIDHSTPDLGGALHWIAVIMLTAEFGPIAYNRLR